MPRQSVPSPTPWFRGDSPTPGYSVRGLAVVCIQPSRLEWLRACCLQHIHFIEFFSPVRDRSVTGAPARCWTRSSAAPQALCTQRRASGPAGETRRSIVGTLAALQGRLGTKRMYSSDYALQGGVGGCIHSVRQCNRARHAPQTMCALDGGGGARGIGRISERPRIWRGV